MSKPIACYINGAGGFGNFGSGIAATCSSGFSCQNTVPGSPTGYCCSTSRVCPAGTSLFRTADGQFQTCSPNRSGGFSSPCPPNYRCVANSGSGATGYCCGQGDAPSVCGANGAVLTDAAGGPRTCQPPSAFSSVFNRCPGGSSCTAASDGQYYCCSGVAGLCGASGQPQLVSRSNLIQLCSRPGDPVCGPGFACTLNANEGQYYCCTAGASEGCPSPGRPLQRNGVTVTCDPRSGNACDNGYSCTATSGGRGVCCSGAGATVCGPGFKVFQPGGTPITCDLNDNKCGNARLCKLYAPSNTYYCCEPDPDLAFCPSGEQPSTTTPCQPNNVNSCPVGFACTPNSLTGLAYCCSDGSASPGACPEGGILQARTCSPQVSDSCPPGATCQLIAGNGVNRYQCCADAAPGAVCANGQAPTSTTCTAAAPSLCPPGTTCLAVVGSSSRRCCPAGPSSAGQPCPNGGTATSTACDPAVGCGVGASCQPLNGFNFCCTGAGAATDDASCPQGGTLQVQIACPGPGSSCGPGNTCQRIPSLGPSQFRCCFGRSSAASTGLCPQGGLPTATPCTLGFPTCPFGSSCQSVPGLGNLCCAAANATTPPPVTCPGGGSIAQPARFCSPSPVDTCADSGTSCQLVDGRYQCCTRLQAPVTTTTAAQASCAAGVPAYINPSTGLNQVLLNSFSNQ